MSIFKSILVFLIAVTLSGCAYVKNNIVSTTMPSVFISTSNPPHVLYAASYVGMQERLDREQLYTLVGVDPVQTEWCAAFVNAILERHGVPGSTSVSEHPLLARSFLSWGESVNEPKRGDIVIFRRGTEDWQGHVAIYLNTVIRDGKTYYRVLGGNQNDEVNVAEYSVNRLLGIRRINNPLLQGQGVRLLPR
jgi:uncharacterized protein (TIGR02594 family)